MEEKVAKKVTNLISQLAADTREVHVDGVSNISKNTASVSFKNLDGNILCPYYYLQTAQANLVAQKLQCVKTATDFIDKVREMIESKCVKIGNDKYRLNPHTLSVLSSYINKNT